MSPTKSRLLQLEAEGQHVFHGSPEPDLAALEPRQGTHVPDLTKPQEMVLDGRPAVSATPYAELAIFRAIINAKNVGFGHTSGFGLSSAGKKQYRVSSGDVLETAAGKTGFVYVFDRAGFEPYDRDGDVGGPRMEWRSYEAVKPVEVIEVTGDDLPPREEIKIGDWA